MENKDLIMNVLYMELGVDIPNMKIVADSSLGNYKFFRALTMQSHNHLVICQNNINKRDMLIIGISIDQNDHEEIEIQSINVNLINPEDEAEYFNSILTVGRSKNSIYLFDRPPTITKDNNFS